MSENPSSITRKHLTAEEIDAAKGLELTPVDMSEEDMLALFSRSGRPRTRISDGAAQYEALVRAAYNKPQAVSVPNATVKAATRLIKSAASALLGENDKPLSASVRTVPGKRGQTTLVVTCAERQTRAPKE